MLRETDVKASDVTREQDMALDSFGLFVHQAQSATGDLQMNTFKIIFDIIMLHGPALLEVKGYGVSLEPAFCLSPDRR